MKRFLLIGVAVLFVAGTIFTAAQAQSPAPDVDGFGPWMGGGRGHGGMMGGGMHAGGFGGMMRGRWNRQGGEYGPMHEYMVEALAEALEITPEELQARFDEGQTPYQIALDLGFSEEEIPTLFSEAHQAALDAAVADGVLTQEQADWMRDHMQYHLENGFGPGRRGPGGCPGWRNWRNQPSSDEGQNS